MRRIAKICFALLLAASVPRSLACGYCVEDRIAAVYDHTAITRALGASHQVVFCAIEGDFIPSNALRREIRHALESITGVDRGSVRVSLDTASLSFTFDPARAPRMALLRTANRKLVINRIKLAQLRVMEQPAELNAEINREE